MDAQTVAVIAAILALAGTVYTAWSAEKVARGRSIVDAQVAALTADATVEAAHVGADAQRDLGRQDALHEIGRGL